MCPAPAVIHGMYKLEEEKKEKSQGSKKKNGRRISSCTATGRSSPPRKIMQVFFFFTSLSVFPVSIARGKKKLKRHPEEGKTIYGSVVYIASRVYRRQGQPSRALSVHFGGKTCFINAYMRGNLPLQRFGLASLTGLIIFRPTCSSHSFSFLRLSVQRNEIKKNEDSRCKEKSCKLGRLLI